MQCLRHICDKNVIYFPKLTQYCLFYLAVLPETLNPYPSIFNLLKIFLCTELSFIHFALSGHLNFSFLCSESHPYTSHPPKILLIYLTCFLFLSFPLCSYVLENICLLFIYFPFVKNFRKSCDKYIS